MTIYLVLLNYESNKDYIETVNGFFLTKEIVLGNMDKMAE